jgi:lysyl-tRNA synthetase class 1
MHWSFKLAEQIVAKQPNKELYTVAAGISPSGSVHIGNYREFITNYYVARALQSMGKNVRLLFSWDNFDRFRKVPKNVQVEGFQKYIGYPYSDVPNPFGDGTYAQHFQAEFESALKVLQMNEVPFVAMYQADEYRSGRYDDQIIHSLKERKKIYDIIASFKTQEESNEAREAYYPIAVYCRLCGRDTTKIVGISADCETVEYRCDCGHNESIGVRKAGNIKLVWKVDWPMRWAAEDVAFEAAGIDHHSDGGSFQVAARVAKEIFGINAPESVCYGWIGIKGLGDMHSSSGINLTPAQLLNIYEPEILRWLYAKYAPMDAFDFGFDETIVRHYSEFDRHVANYFAGNMTEDYEKAVYQLCLFKDTRAKSKVSFGSLTTVAPLAEFNEALIKNMLAKAGDSFTADSSERVQKVKFWLENYAPDKIYKLLVGFNFEFYNTLSDEQKATLNRLHEFLVTDHSEAEIQQHLYDLINKPDATKKENQAAQREYFKVFYNMLFGRDDGPRLYLYLAAANKDKYLPLLKK